MEVLKLEINVADMLDWLKNNILTLQYIIQLIILLFVTIISYFISGSFQENGLKDKISKLLGYIKFISKENLNRELANSIWPIIGTALIWLYVLLAINLMFPYQFLMAVGHLLNAWIVIKIVSSFIQSDFMSRFISFFVWIIAALKILGVYNDLVNYLDEIIFSSGDYIISVMTIINGIIIISILIYIADKLSDILELRINKLESLTPAAKILIRKFVRILLMVIAGLIGMSSLGINLTAFAFLGGTLGVGLGFGLQKVVSNFVSGVIILMDRSVKPGDVIEINNNYGYINSLETRFVSLITRGGKEYLIPNEDFITQTVINWSYSDRLVRIDVKIGISYNSELREVISLIQDSIKYIERINKEPEPRCIVEEFGESSINLICRFWISDPDQGIANIKSDVLLRIWDVFKENNIEIPYPQRDLYIKSDHHQKNSREFGQENNDQENNQVNI